MVGCRSGCHFCVQSALAENRESLVTQCVCMRCPHHMTSGPVPFKGGYSAIYVYCLKEGLRDQEGFCTLQKQPGETTDACQLLGSTAFASTHMILVMIVALLLAKTNC